jgi:hypothetical protein
MWNINVNCSIVVGNQRHRWVCICLLTSIWHNVALSWRSATLLFPSLRLLLVLWIQSAVIYAQPLYTTDNKKNVDQNLESLLNTNDVNCESTDFDDNTSGDTSYHTTFIFGSNSWALKKILSILDLVALGTLHHL